MSRADRLALLISMMAVLAALLVADLVFERMAHIEDEMAFVWQAQAIARGKLTVPSPPNPKSFLVPFVIDLDGQRFSKYPPGWPVVLSFGERLGLRLLVNPLLAGFGVWLTYRLGKRLLGATVGLLAAGLTVTSPFFLMNSGSLLSHPLGLVLSAAFALVWLDGFGKGESAEGSAFDWENASRSPAKQRFAAFAGDCSANSGRPRVATAAPRRWLPTVTAGLTLGVLALTRPLTAAGVALPFGLHGLYLLWRGDRQTRLQVLAVGGIAAALASLLLVWQYELTGDPFKNPYTLWWEYDRIGFGEGHGLHGHNWYYVKANLGRSLWAGMCDLFGWGSASWLILPFGAWAVRHRPRAILVCSVFFSIVLAYTTYWIGSWLFGPRYYYEGLYSLTLLTGAGIAWIAGWPTAPSQERAKRSFAGVCRADSGRPLVAEGLGLIRPGARGWRRARPLAVTALVAFLAAATVFIYLPIRLGGMHGLYGVRRADIVPFQSPHAQALAPALIIVYSDRWESYGELLELENAFLDTPLIFAISRTPEENQVLAHRFSASGRHVYHYYTDEPGVLHNRPRASQAP